jgi:sensor histidine kinase YesM
MHARELFYSRCSTTMPVNFMYEGQSSNRTILLVIMLAVFARQFWINWLTADAPFWSIMAHEAGLPLEEFASTLTFRNILLTVTGTGTSIGLLLLNYYLGKRYKLTRTSTIVLLFALVISVLLGFFLGYGIKQLQIPEYPILNIGIIANIPSIPSRLLSTITWCMLGMLAGNYKREIEEKKELVE